jgi:hypothetical protein
MSGYCFFYFLKAGTGRRSVVAKATKSEDNWRHWRAGLPFIGEFFIYISAARPAEGLHGRQNLAWRVRTCENSNPSC